MKVTLEHFRKLIKALNTGPPGRGYDHRWAAISIIFLWPVGILLIIWAIFLNESIDSKLRLFIGGFVCIVAAYLFDRFLIKMTKV